MLGEIENLMSPLIAKQGPKIPSKVLGLVIGILCFFRIISCLRYYINFNTYFFIHIILIYSYIHIVFIFILYCIFYRIIIIFFVSYNHCCQVYKVPIQKKIMDSWKLIAGHNFRIHIETEIYL